VPASPPRARACIAGARATDDDARAKDNDVGASVMRASSRLRPRWSRAPAAASTRTSSRASRASSRAWASTRDGETGSRARSVLFLGWEWIEVDASAAGVRSDALVRGALARSWRVTCVGCASENAATARLREMGAATARVPANRGDALRDALAAAAPDVVVFDRFLAEEAFGARVRECAPGVARVLDMQDAHALRRARERAAARGADAAETTRTMPTARDEDLMREIASVERSDLTLVCSPVEKKWLERECGISEKKLRVASFFNRDVTHDAREMDFNARTDFITIGTFKHKPNVDSVRWLCEEVWPLVRERLPNATMRVYGSYASESIRQQFHRPKMGFHVEGFAEDLATVMRSSRVLLAPLRFGAGIKGKVLDAWTYGLPVCTTPIGSEGTVPGVDEFWSASSGAIDPEHGWGGFGDCITASDLADAAVRLHEDDALWQRARANGAGIVNEIFSAKSNIPEVLDAIEEVVDNLEKVRDADFHGQSLWMHTDRSTLYFSKWIELKETGENT